MELFGKCKGGGIALLARWTMDFDCGYETNWWYLIRKGPIGIQEMSRNSRKSIRKSLENCRVERINPYDCLDDLYRVYMEAVSRYKFGEERLRISKEEYAKTLNPDGEWWAGYKKDDGTMIGYQICIIGNGYVNFSVSKYSALHLKMRVSDALNWTLLDEYLNKREIKYVLNGERNILHVTNVQNYYMEHFRFEKAYCMLRIKYRWFTGIIVGILYPFRRLIGKIENSFAHKIHAVLMMEEVRRCDANQSY